MATESNKGSLTELQQKVNELLSQVTNADGKIDWSLAKEQVSPEMQVAVLAEKRRRDTQREFTRRSQELKKLSAQKELLEKQLENYIAKYLTKEEQEELKDLKYEDPDAYIERIRGLEEAAAKKAKEEKEKILKEAQTKSAEEIELERRQRILEEFNEAHPDTPLTPEMLELEVPVRVVKSLERGEITFEQALEEAHKFIYGSKIIKKEEVPEEPDLNKVGSSTETSTKEDDQEVIW